MHDLFCIEIYIYLKGKFTQKSKFPIQLVLGLTLSDLGDLKHSMPGGADSAPPLFIFAVA